MQFTIHDAASIAYGTEYGKLIQGGCVSEETERRAHIYNAAYKCVHIEAGDDFFIEAMKNARHLMPNMMNAYKAFDYTELGILMGLALQERRRALAEQETVRIMNEKQD